MLVEVADGVLVHASDFVQTNTVVVQGTDGVLLVDPGITGPELSCLADDLRDAARTVVLGFSTHPDWDHLLWHPRLGQAPRYGTERGAAAARDQASDPETMALIAAHLPPEIQGQVPLDLLGLIDGLPAGTTQLPWDGPAVRVIEHRAHAPGHAALLVEERGVLVAGDMLSDVLVPMLDLDGAVDPVEDYLAALRLVEAVAGDVDVLVPGHGSVARGVEVRTRIELDRSYVQALRDGDEPDDPRLGPSARDGWEWVSDVHAGQVQRLAGRRGSEGTPGQRD